MTEVPAHIGDGEPASRARVSWTAIGTVAAGLAALWLLDAFVLHTDLLAPIGGLPPTSPIYGVFLPRVQAWTAFFLIAAASFVAAAPRLCDPALTSGRKFGAILFSCGILLPFAFFMVRAQPGSLGGQFSIYRGEEFFHDAQRVADYGAFLTGYVESMPGLSLHGRHFPPGHASLLHVVRTLFGPSELAAGLAILVSAAAGLVCAWRALRQLASEACARQGACLLLATPSLVDFACVSMDAVFFALASLAWWLSLRATRSGRARDALVAGAALFAATFFSFSALPLGLAVLLQALIAGRLHLARTAGLLALAGAAWLACALLLFWASGFSIWACFLRAHDLSAEFMEGIVARRAHADRFHIAVGNASAFLLGAGVGLVAAVVLALRSRAVRRAASTRASLIALLVMVVAPIYWMETERIWLYALPWLAAIAVSDPPFEPTSLRRLLAAGLTQALVMETVLFTLW